MFLRKNADGEAEPSFWHKKPGPAFGGVILGVGLLLIVIVTVFDLRALWSLGFVLVGGGISFLLRGLIANRKR